jgi:CHASE2 domain-containing sensor protein
MEQAKKIGRTLFLASGKGTRWDLMKAMTFSGLFGLSAGLLVYGWPSPWVMMSVLLTCGGVIFGFTLAHGRLWGKG